MGEFGKSKLKQYKDEVIEMRRAGATLEEIADKYNVATLTVRDNLRVWGAYNERPANEPTVMNKARERRHTREVVIVNGKPMLDVTDYIVDCGGC